MTTPPRVVIVGAGFAGIEAAKALAHAPVSLTVIDRNNYHCFQPLLYQVATAALSPTDVSWPIRRMLKAKNTTVLFAELIGIDPERQEVRLVEGALPYDFLILATGSTHSYFGHHWEPFAPGLKTIEDALALRNRLLVAFETAEVEASLCGDDDIPARFVVIGGGPTGVELAGAIAELAFRTLPTEFRQIDTRRARVTLIEGGDRVLPTFSPDASDYARRALTSLGVEVLTGTSVVDCDARGVTTNSGTIEATSIFWAAGVRASSTGAMNGAVQDKQGRIEVAGDLTIPAHPNIYAVGDLAHVRHGDGTVPGVAPAAKQMGRYAGRHIAGRLQGRSSISPFQYRHQGDLATIGRRRAVVRWKGLDLRGALGWYFWSVVHIYYLIGLRSRVSVFLAWVWQYVRNSRSNRLIIRGTDMATGTRTPEDDGAGPN